MKNWVTDTPGGPQVHRPACSPFFSTVKRNSAQMAGHQVICSPTSYRCQFQQLEEYSLLEEPSE